MNETELLKAYYEQTFKEDLKTEFEDLTPDVMHLMRSSFHFATFKLDFAVSELQKALSHSYEKAMQTMSELIEKL